MVIVGQTPPPKFALGITTWKSYKTIALSVTTEATVLKFTC